MKRHSLTTITVLLALLITISLMTSAATPPPLSPYQITRTEIEAAIRQAIDRQEAASLAFLMYETRIANIVISPDQSWAKADLIPVDPATGLSVPAEPGLAIVSRSGKDWRAFLPSDPAWLEALRSSPDELLPRQDKDSWLADYRLAAQNITGLGPFGGYLLPWTAGESKYLTQSVHHDKYTPSGNAHYAFDFASGGTINPMFNILAAKAGRVARFYDGYPNGDPNNANLIVLEDTTTSPTTYQLYLHLAQNSIPPELRTIGAEVRQGQFIGIADDTGQSSGNHLHFMVHTNPASYWGTSVDITFRDVGINGGRPRIAADLAYCRDDATYQDVCDATSPTYISGNYLNSDRTPPVGDIFTPLNGSALTSPDLHLEGWASDAGSGLASAQFLARYNGSWHAIGSAYSTSPFSMEWNLCASNVPDGPVDLALRLRDQAGNQTLNLPGLRHVIKNYTCPVLPPACTPGANQVALFADPAYIGSCTLFAVGSYPTAAALGAVGADNAASIQVGSNVLATLYFDPSYGGRSQTFSVSDSNLADNRIGSDQVSSLVVSQRNSLPAVPFLKWPTDNASAFTWAQPSLSLVWEDGGGATEFEARLISPTKTITMPLSAALVWHLGSLANGDYTWQVRAHNSAGYSAWSGSYHFTVQYQQTNQQSIAITSPYTDTMENGSNGWQNSNNWDQTTIDNHTPGGAASWMYDVNDATTGYDDGKPSTGDLTSPAISLPAGTPSTLSFWYLYETESPGIHWDQRWVQLSVNGSPFVNWLLLSDDPPNYWLRSPLIDLSVFGGSTIRVRFHFETLDNTANSYRGWFIDDFSISTSPIAACADSYEPNDVPGQALSISPNSSITSQICPGGDVDYYRFTGTVGDQVGISTAAQVSGSQLDTVLILLDSDGASTLAQNDDLVPYTLTDSFVTYKLTRSGTYYIKLRAWDHPTGGGSDYSYTLRLVRENTTPVAAFVSPPSGSFLPESPISVTIVAQDASSGISHIEFYWHSGDWLNDRWTLLGTDWDGQDGWNTTFDVSAIPYQSGIGLFAWVYDWAGNRIGIGVWNLTKAHEILYLPILTTGP
jgi:murein DD-endopeptidase MepM/ murein hydrolase activator NlpD